MLEELHIKDLALIEEAWLEFSPGMTVLTGETGAGKTVLLGGLKLLLGERADSGAVRSEAREALVEGRFCTAERELLARRRVGADGRSRCTLDGEMATVGALSERLGPTVDLHGQHEHQALLSASTHCGYLDRWAGESVADALSAYREARGRWSDDVARREEVASRVEEAARDADYLCFIVSEIERVDPQPGEDEALQAKLPALQHSEKLAEAAFEVASQLRGDGGALDSIARAREALAKVSGIDDAVDALDSRLGDAAVAVDDVGVTARAYRDAIDHDPASLDRTLTRLGELNGLMKKYGPTLSHVLERLASARASLTLAEQSDEALHVAENAVAQSEMDLRECATALDGVRRAAAPGFTSALSEAISELSMDSAHFEVAFRELPFASWMADGPSRVEFLFASARGQAPQPLSRIASGGEISRVMLALKGVLGSADTVATLVFDEVDAGIGGATATAVGARLAQLATTHQVIVVTHLAQVAAYADSHIVVRKQLTDDGAVTDVTPVTGDERVREVARMLSGNESSASRVHAAELLASAHDGVTAR